MGNQQERPILGLDALAGLIVGEGSYWIGIARMKNRPPELRPGFSIRMNDLDTMDMIGEAFRFQNLPFYRCEKLQKNCATIQVVGMKRMVKHLDVFLPVLFGRKREAALLVAEIVNRRKGKTGRQAPQYDEHDIRVIEKLREINGPNVRRFDLGILRDYMRRPEDFRRVRESPTS